MDASVSLCLVVVVELPREPSVLTLLFSVSIHFSNSSTDTYGNWPNGGEIDVMETVGHEVETFFGTVHTLSSNQAGSPDGSQLNKSKSEWHIFEMEWRENNIKFAIDGQIYHQYDKNGAGWESWPFDQEFHLLMNVAVGGPWAGRYGIDAASFEGAGQVMEVDWVRVYE